MAGNDENVSGVERGRAGERVSEVWVMINVNVIIRILNRKARQAGTFAELKEVLERKCRVLEYLKIRENR